MTRHTIRHHGVPYYTQWGSPEWVRSIVYDDADPCADPHWQRSGFTDPEHYRFWAKRLCGLTCLESILDFWGVARPSRAVLLDQALQHGAYRLREDGGVDGLIYRPFAEWVGAQFGLQVEVLPSIPIEALAGRLDHDTLAIASVNPHIRRAHEPVTTRGGHLVLLVGRDAEGTWFHNPSGVEPHQADVYLPFETFARFFGERGMTITRQPRTASEAS
ncbi:C39 family peptidase [Trinickia fusca]|uniref:Peptidase C39-like domain-containing protein n=1 Tax=Trinickia fusca TaxID=2419777 RepID=A0A494WZG2_9BURK|nr:C39 family peptidase [Trinickia fusca]RKP43857.1 hypothetical protein D7S89_24570 [Trinickia fusca]